MKINVKILTFLFASIVAILATCTAVHEKIAPSTALTTAAGDHASSEGKLVEDWFLSEFQMPGIYTDTMGSRLDAVLEDGPDGQKALKLTSKLVLAGWCGIGRGNSADLSTNTAFKFKLKTSARGEMLMILRDACNVQYTSKFRLPSKEWAEVTVPFSSFKKDFFYTPPGAILGQPLDLTWTRAIGFMPQIIGDSVVEIGPIIAVGTGGNFIGRAAGKADDAAQAKVVKITRAGGTPISPYAFGNCYYDWLDWGKDGLVGLKGSAEAVKALHLNVIVCANNMNDANTYELFDNAHIDKYIQYCRAAGAEPIMIVPVYGNNVNGGPMSAQMAADIVTYVNGTRKYGVKYWSIGTEVDIYNLFFKRETDLPVSTVSQYAAVYKSYAKAMLAANTAAHSGVDLKFVGPELGARYNEGDDWLSPMLDECKDYIDVVSIHAYGYSARELCVEGALRGIEQFPAFVQEVKARIAKHARPGTPLAITESNISYDAFTKSYTPETRKVGPGTFYAAIWDADRMGAALEANLWSFDFWALAEPVQAEASTVFGFILTDSSKNPPTCKLTPEYYAQWMVANNFSGTTVKPSEVPNRMSVYASYDKKKAVTAILVVNKNTVERVLTLAVDDLKPQTITFAPMSINIVTIPDDTAADYRLLEYTKQMADAGSPPKVTH